MKKKARKGNGTSTPPGFLPGAAERIKRHLALPGAPPAPAPPTPAHIAHLAAIFAAQPAAVGVPHACPLFYQQVEILVVAVIQSYHPTLLITPGKRFKEDLGIDKPMRENYYTDVFKQMAIQGCGLRTLQAADFRRFDTVRDLCVGVFDDRA